LFSPNSRTIATGEKNLAMALRSMPGGNEILRFQAHTDDMDPQAFSPDGKLLVAKCGDGSLALLDVQSGKEFAQLVVFKDGEWIVITPEGYYDSSTNGYKYINVTIGLEVFDIDQFFQDFYRPGLFADVLKGRDYKKQGVNLASKLRSSRPPEVKIQSPSVGHRFTTRNVEVVIQCTDKGGGIQDVRLYHNDKRVREETRGVKVVTADFTKTYQVALVEGENRLRATAFSKGRIESKSHEILIFLSGGGGRSTSHIFVIGIDKYKNKKYNLNYARADALAVRALIQEKSGSLFENIQVYELFDEEATSDNIKTTFQQITSVSGPQDVFTFFYAGHGVMLTDQEGEEQFYLAPYEVTSLYSERRIHKSGISGQQLVEFSRDIPATKQLYIIDACQAGSISDAFALRGAAEEKALAQLARSAGVHVVASTGSEQFATEFKELGHGLFTYALIQAVEGAADGAPEDGKITVRELNAYLEDMIPELSEKFKGQPQFPVVFSKGQDFPVVVK